MIETTTETVVPDLKSIVMCDASPVKEGRKTVYLPMVRLKGGHNWFFPGGPTLRTESAAIAFAQAYILGYQAGRDSR